MAAVYTIPAHPKGVDAPGWPCGHGAPVERTDVDALQKFFLGIPEEERFFLKYSSARPLLLSPSFDQEQMRAVRLIAQDGAEDGIRTRDPLLGKEVLYH